MNCKNLFVVVLLFVLSMTLTSCYFSGDFSGPKGDDRDEIEIFFVENGGSQVESILVFDGELPIKPTNPTRLGYTFDGWFIDSELTQPFNWFEPLEDDDSITLYAKWSPIATN